MTTKKSTAKTKRKKSKETITIPIDLTKPAEPKRKIPSYHVVEIIQIEEDIFHLIITQEFINSTRLNK